MTLAPHIAFAATLLLVIALSEPVAARIRAPFPLVLTGVGALTALLVSGFGGEVPSGLPSGLLLTLFLPALIFQAALSTEIRRMVEDGVAILILAVLAVIAATLLIGLAVHPFAGLPLLGSLLLAALVSTTDPSAVIGLFRSINAPARLVRLVEGESLLNDATAIALFGVFLTGIATSEPDPDLLRTGLRLFLSFSGGILFGACVGWALLIGLRLIRGRASAQVTLTLTAPFLASLPADLIGLSGVIAAFSAGAVLNLGGPARIGPDGWDLTRRVWDMLSHWGGALIFLLTALLIPSLLTGFGWGEAGLVLVMAVAALGARGLILWGVLPLLPLVRLGLPVPAPFRIALLWGGLRGAMTLALALAIREAPAVPEALADRIGALATGYVLFTLFVQGGSLTPLVRRLRLDQPSPLDQALAREAVAVALQTAREEVSDEARQSGVDQEVLRREARLLGERERAAVEAAERTDGLSEKDRITLGLIALAGRERDLVVSARRQGRISASLHERLLRDCDRLIEQTRSGGRPGYRRAYRTVLNGSAPLRMAWALHDRLRIRGPLERIMEARFEMMIAQAGLLADLPGYIDARIRRIHGRRVTALLHALIRRRQEEVRDAIEALRLQFPGYAEETEARWVRRTALEVEEREYGSLLEDRLIDEGLHARLLGDLSRRRASLERPPRLDLIARKEALLKGMPALKGLPDRDLRRLAKSLHLRRMSPGDLLHRRDDPPGRIHLIGSGAVIVHSKTGDQKLGPGELFGHISVLTGTPRRIEVRALTHGTLFRLEESRLRHLMAASPEIRRHVDEGARRSGVAPIGPVMNKDQHD